MTHSERRAEMVKLYAMGKTLAEIGKQYGISRQAVHQQLERAGFPRRDRNWRYK